MATEYPPLNKIYVFGYSANDRDYPIVSLTADPRVAGYQVPKDLSVCPDKRYPNHVFTGAQPIAGDQRVRHVWEILPSPWVPFTRYDDDLGPIQGRRRSVKNEGQVASLTDDKRTTYEAREGSAIVYTELEETWSIKTDEDGNSLFPIRDRDFYDPSRGPVQERRQLFVPTGEEVGSLENVNGVITQTSYEPYNEFLSVKIVQTYKVNGPQLIGRATDNEGQLVTITTQRKAADGYVPPSPTATRTVEANREDAESLVERIVDTPQVFGAEVYRRTREDITPQKFKAAQEDTTTEQNIEGTASPTITLSTGEFAKSEQQINKFVKRVSTTARAIDEAVTLVEAVLTNDGQLAQRTLTLQAGTQSFTPSSRLVDASVEALGDGRTVKTTVTVGSVFNERQETLEKPDTIPSEFRANNPNTTTSEVKDGTSASVASLEEDEISKTRQRVTEHKIRETVVSRPESYESLEDKIIDDDLIVVTRTRSVSEEPEEIVPSATVSGSIVDIGGGYKLKTVDNKERVFRGDVFSQEKPDNIPVEFRAEKPSTTKEFSEEGTAAEVTLSGIEISKSEQQVNEFVKRVRTTERDIIGGVELVGEQIDQDGVKIIVTRRLAEGPQFIVPSATISGNVENIGDNKTIKTTLQKLDIFDSKTIGIQQSVQLPAKFITGEQEEESIVSESTIPTPEQLGENGIGVVESTAQRVSEFTVRKTKTTRDGITSLEEKQLNNEGQEITIASSIVDSPEIESGATVEIARSQSIGGGKYLKEIGTVENLFDSKQETLSQSVQIPAKFFSGEITETSIVEEGEEAVPDPIGNDGFGIIQSTAQRISQFKVRKTQRTQNGDASLSERQSNNFKQKITVTSSIDDDPEISLNATTEFARSEAIGGGKYLKEVGVVSGVFNNRSLSASRPDVLPERFRAAIPTITTQETVAQTSVSQPSLGTNDIEKTETRLTDFTVRKSTVSRNISGTPTLSGMDYEESFDVQIPYTEKIQNSIPTGSAEAVPLDNQRFLVREYDPDDIESYLSSFLQTYPTTINMNLPRVLEAVEVTWDEKQQAGRYINTPTAGGVLYQFASSDKGEASSFASVTPLVNLRFRDVWSQNIPATVHVFFLKNPVSESEILSKTGSVKWPTFKPKSHTITGKGVEIRATVNVAASISIQQSKPNEFGGYSDRSRQRDFSRSIIPISINVPPCLHENINLNAERPLSTTVSAAAETASYGLFGPLISSETASIDDVAFVRGDLGATTPTSIPTSGVYLIESSVEFFKYGFSIVRATTINANIFAS